LLPYAGGGLKSLENPQGEQSALGQEQQPKKGDR
jgi:hypothetical protein